MYANTAHDGVVILGAVDSVIPGSPIREASSGLRVTSGGICSYFGFIDGQNVGFVPSITWQANCSNVDVQVTTCIGTWLSPIGNANERYVTWDFTGLGFDWWRNFNTQTQTLEFTRPDGLVETHDVTLVLDLRDCGDYYDYYVPPDPELEPCYDLDLHPLFVDIDFSLYRPDLGGGTPPAVLEIGGTFAMPWTGSEYASAWTSLAPGATGYSIRVAMRKNTTPEIHGDPSDGETCAPEGGWPGGVVPEGWQIWDTIMEVRDQQANLLFTQTLANTCLLCGPDEVFGLATWSRPLGPRQLVDEPWHVQAEMTVYG
jgi:hypothetical protein